MKKALSFFVSLALTASLVAPASTLAEQSSSTLGGFVKTDGTKFTLDGSPFYYAGTNCYYLNFKQQADIDNELDDAAAMGLKVVRTWGDIDAGVKTGQVDSNGYPVFSNNSDGSGQKDGIYYQYFDSTQNKPIVNGGADGLQKLDYVIYKASQKGMKLLIDFTNNWSDFGGMNQYVLWAKQAGENVNGHDDFYTNAKIKDWYKNYVNTLLNRTNSYTGIKYKDDPTIFSWELANEPRAESDSGCVKNILGNWVTEMSSYVKSIDKNHLLTVGDEGFYNIPYNQGDTPSNWVYHGSEGYDWNSLIKTPNIDFGTVHLYTDSWSFQNTSDADYWIKKHGVDAKNANKPVILEEYGLKDRSTRTQTYNHWFDILSGKTYTGVEYAGSNFWMLASLMTTGGLYPDYDNYTVYLRPDSTGNNPTADTAKAIETFAAEINAKNICNTVSPSQVSYDLATPSDIAINYSLKSGQFSGLNLGGIELRLGTDYTTSGNTVILKSSFLSTLSEGTTTLNFSFGNGTTATLTITVSDSTVTPPTPTKTTYEFEDANSFSSNSGNKIAHDAFPGYSGSGYVYLVSGWAEVKFNIKDAGKYKIIIASNSDQYKENWLYLDSNSAGTLKTNANTWNKSEYTFDLSTGDHKFGVSSNWGYVALDYVSVERID